jgi:GNAT superfamily N-acetyltransferase
VLIHPAESDDCVVLAETSKRAFDADVTVGAPTLGGPPGYDSVAWHVTALTWGQVFTIAHDGRVVGGAIVVPQSATDARLGRVWLVPEAQNRGLGRQVMTGIEALFPSVTRWTLDTPVWNTRNHHFYARCGYQVIGTEGNGDLLFEKLTVADAPSA